MSTQFAVRRLDSLLAPAGCDLAALIAKEGWMWSMLMAEMTLGVSGYYMLYCYLAT